MRSSHLFLFVHFVCHGEKLFKMEQLLLFHTQLLNLNQMMMMVMMVMMVMVMVMVMMMMMMMVMMMASSW